MKKQTPLIIFWLLVANSAFILAQFFIPAVRNLFKGTSLFIIPILIFFLIGIALIVSTLLEKVKRPLSIFFILTGAGASGFFVSVFLHNFIYGILIYFFGENAWNNIGVPDEPIFFLLAIFGCPILFFVGLIGSVITILFKKNN